MSQYEVLERLYHIPELTIEDLSVILDLTPQSIKNSISRLKKVKYIDRSEKRGYVITSKGKQFMERMLL